MIPWSHDNFMNLNRKIRAETVDRSAEDQLKNQTMKFKGSWDKSIIHGLSPIFQLALRALRNIYGDAPG